MSDSGFLAASSTANCSGFSRPRKVGPLGRSDVVPPSFPERRHRSTDRTVARRSVAIAALLSPQPNRLSASSRNRSCTSHPPTVSPPPCAYRMNSSYRRDQPPITTGRHQAGKVSDRQTSRDGRAAGRGARITPAARSERGGAAYRHRAPCAYRITAAHIQLRKSWSHGRLGVATEVTAASICAARGPRAVSSPEPCAKAAPAPRGTRPHTRGKARIVTARAHGRPGARSPTEAYGNRGPVAPAGPRLSARPYTQAYGSYGFSEAAHAAGRLKAAPRSRRSRSRGWRRGISGPAHRAARARLAATLARGLAVPSHRACPSPRLGQPAQPAG